MNQAKRINDFGQSVFDENKTNQFLKNLIQSSSSVVKLPVACCQIKRPQVCVPAMNEHIWSELQPIESHANNNEQITLHWMASLSSLMQHML